MHNEEVMFIYLLVWLIFKNTQCILD